MNEGAGTASCVTRSRPESRRRSWPPMCPTRRCCAGGREHGHTVKQPRPHGTDAHAASPGSVKQAAEAAPAGLKRIVPSQLDPDDDVCARLTRAASVRAHSIRVRRGDLVHRLLQCLPDLPVGERAGFGRAMVREHCERLRPADRDALADEALRVIEHPELADLFGPGSRAEVEFIARSGADEIVGRIDRLAVTPEHCRDRRLQDGRAAQRTQLPHRLTTSGSLRSTATYWRACIPGKPCAPCSSGLRGPQSTRSRRLC